jgi:RNase P subunit RPR2
MTECDHRNLVLLTDTAKRLRCRYCHLTIRADEVKAGYCPECFESSGKKRAEFEPVDTPAATRYQCEACGEIIEYVPRKS